MPIGLCDEAGAVSLACTLSSRAADDGERQRGELEHDEHRDASAATAARPVRDEVEAADHQREADGSRTTPRTTERKVSSGPESRCSDGRRGHEPAGDQEARTQ